MARDKNNQGTGGKLEPSEAQRGVDTGRNLPTTHTDPAILSAVEDQLEVALKTITALEVDKEHLNGVISSQEISPGVTAGDRIASLEKQVQDALAENKTLANKIAKLQDKPETAVDHVKAAIGVLEAGLGQGHSGINSAHAMLSNHVLGWIVGS